MPRLTPALRAALVAAALLLLLQSLPAATLLEYRRSLLLHEPWRALTAHIVHVNWTHALVNAGAWIVLARLFEPVFDARRQWLCMAIGAAVVSVVLATLYPAIAWYRGASGILHALYFAGASAAMISAWRRPRRWPSLLWAVALFSAGWIKVMLEFPPGALTPYATWLGSTVVPQAHLTGALFGTAYALLAVRRRR